jgi:hypothetical protein
MLRLRVIEQLIFVAAIFPFASCSTEKTWTATELRDWYSSFAGGEPQYSQLFYFGSNDKYHYFRCRAIDDWMQARVERDEIEMLDIRPFLPISEGPFPGYYPVDPLNGYQKIDDSPILDERNSVKDGAV